MGLQDHQVRVDQQENLDLQVFLVPQEPQDTWEKMEPQDPWDLQDPQEALAPQDSQERRETLVLLVFQEPQVCQELQVCQDHKDHQDHLDQSHLCLTSQLSARERRAGFSASSTK